MASPLKLKRPKKDPLKMAKTKLPSKVWVFKWVWTLDSNATAKDISGYKKDIIAYCVEKLEKFNIRNGTKYKPVPDWSTKTVGGILKLIVRIILRPAPKRPAPGSGLLTPPAPKQPPPPAL